MKISDHLILETLMTRAGHNLPILIDLLHSEPAENAEADLAKVVAIMKASMSKAEALMLIWLITLSALLKANGEENVLSTLAFCAVSMGAICEHWGECAVTNDRALKDAMLVALEPIQDFHGHQFVLDEKFDRDSYAMATDMIGQVKSWTDYEAVVIKASANSLSQKSCFYALSRASAYIVYAKDILRNANHST